MVIFMSHLPYRTRAAHDIPPPPVTCRSRAGFLLTVVVIATIAVACTRGGSTSQVSGPSAPTSTGVTGTGPVMLTVWDPDADTRIVPGDLVVFGVEPGRMFLFDPTTTEAIATV
jgi:hypothetical protein